MDEDTTANHPLTINDPVDLDTLERFGQLDMSNNQVCRRLGEMELERVRIVRALATIESERTKLFEKILIDRGIPIDTVIHINPQTGEIKTDLTSDVPEVETAP